MVSTTRPTILLIDDEDDLRAQLCVMLEHAGYAVIEAATGPKGLTLAEQHRPDLILLDLHLPHMSGQQVWVALRQTPALRDTPVLILTAQSRINDKFWKQSLPADDYITKPFDPVALLQRIAEKIQR